MAPPKAGDFDRKMEFIRQLRPWRVPRVLDSGARRLDLDTGRFAELMHVAALDFGRIVLEFQERLLAALFVETGKVWAFTLVSPPYRPTVVASDGCIGPISLAYIDGLAAEYHSLTTIRPSEAEIAIRHEGTTIVVEYARRSGG